MPNNYPALENIVPELLTTREAAKLCGMGERSLWRYSKIGAAPAAVTICGSRRYRKSELLAWIENGCKRSRPGREVTSHHLHCDNTPNSRRWCNGCANPPRMCWDTSNVYGSALTSPGDPVIGSQENVEAAAEWDGEPGLFFSSALECGPTGFIEAVPDRPDLYQVHDLYDHAPEYVKKRKQREEERKAKNRKSSGQRQTTADNGGRNVPMAENGAPPRTRTRAHSRTRSHTRC